MAPMSERNLRTVVAALVVLLVLVVGATVVVLSGRNGQPSASPSPSSAAGPSASAASPSPSASVAASASTAPSPAISSAPSSSVGASFTPPPVPLATVTFIGLKLDPTSATGSLPRIITFASDGAGTVSVKVATASGTTPAKTHMCLKVGTKVVGCNDITSGTFTGKTNQAHANWTVTLEGTAAAAPDVNLTLTYQTLVPTLKIENARFDGTAFPDTNGIQVRLTARTTGQLHLVADWGGHPFLYEVDLFDETSGTGNQTLANQGPSTNVDTTFPVTPGDWRLVLQNIEAGFGVTDLTATIGWP